MSDGKILIYINKAMMLFVVGLTHLGNSQKNLSASQTFFFRIKGLGASEVQTCHLRYIQILIVRFNLRTIQNTKTYNINL